MRMIPKATSVLASIALFASSGVMAGEVRVDVQGAEPGEGKVRVGLFEAEGFPDTPLRGKKTVADGKGRMTVHFTDLQTGDYAVSAYQDLSGTGELDTNLVGAPSEPYGFSQGAESRFGPPDFEAAAFSVKDSLKRIDVTLE